MKASRFLLVLLAASVLLFVTVVMRSAGVIGPGTQPPGTTVDLAYAFTDVDGKPVRLADFRGKPIVVNLWATWCGPCRIEMPQLVELAAKYGPRITVVGISVDDTPDQIREFAGEFKVAYPMLVGRGHEDALAALGYDGSVPMTILIDTEGHVRNRVLGIRTTETWERHIDALF
jgi:thiol-disulfide isomerase/thioredoxin